MTKRKKNADLIADILGTPELKVPAFLAGQAAEVLGIPLWRLQKFLSSPRYKLAPAKTFGKGSGSRRVFSVEDLYRFALAIRLTRDGFAAKFIGEILEGLQDHEFVGPDNRGEEAVLGITLSRGPKGPTLGFFRSGNPPELRVDGPVYYALDLTNIVEEVNAKVRAIAKGRD